MTAERSERGELTTNAYVETFDINYFWEIANTQWRIENNEILSYNFYMPNPTSGNNKWQLTSLTFYGTDNQDHELLFSIKQREYNSSYNRPIQMETSWYNTGFNFTLGCAQQSVNSSTYQQPAFTIYIKRADGGYLTRTDMDASRVIGMRKIFQEVEQTTAIPQNWLESTTANFQNPMDTYTTIIPTEYDISSSQYDPLLEIPSKIDTAINFIILGFGRIMNFKYISFVVCFVLIVGLVAWLIH